MEYIQANNFVDNVDNIVNVTIAIFPLSPQNSHFSPRKSNVQDFGIEFFVLDCFFKNLFKFIRCFCNRASHTTFADFPYVFLRIFVWGIWR